MADTSIGRKVRRVRQAKGAVAGSSSSRLLSFFQAARGVMAGKVVTTLRLSRKRLLLLKVSRSTWLNTADW